MLLQQLRKSPIILLGPQYRVARIKIVQYPHSFRAEQRLPHYTRHWDQTPQVVDVVAGDTHFAASQSLDELVDPLYKELVTIAAVQWRNSADFAETGVGTVRRECGVTYSQKCFAQLG